MDVNLVNNYTPSASVQTVQTPTPVPASTDDARSAPTTLEAEGSVASSVSSILPETSEYTYEQGADLQRAVTGLNRSLSLHQRHMSVATHEATRRTMVTVYNTDTREVIREIPPERVLDAHASLLEMAGLLMDTRG